MMLRSAASPGFVGSAGRLWRIVASSYRCQNADRPLFQSVDLPARQKAKTPPEKAAFSFVRLESEAYLIFVSLNSTCLWATGSYFRFAILSVMVRLFFLVT